MARVKPISEIAGLSGKLSKNDDYYLYHNKVTGKTETRRINYNRHRKPTKAQVASRTAFKEKQDVVIAWFNENKPTKERPDGTELYQQMRKAFWKQHKIGTIYSYVWQMLFPKKK